MDKILLSIADSDITVREIIPYIADCQARMPDYEVFMDGDTRSIVARPRPIQYVKNKSSDYKAMLGVVR